MGRSSVVSALTAGVFAISAGTALVVHRSLSVQAAPPAAIPRCSNVQLLVRPTTTGSGAAGHLVRVYSMKLLFGGQCRLQGYPGVELLDRTFHSLPTHLMRGHGQIIKGAPPTSRVVIDANHPAYFALEYSDVPIGNQPCVPASSLMVTPPNDYLPVVTYSGGIVPCSGNIVVSPVGSAQTLPSR